MNANQVPTLFSWAGGAPAFRKMIDAFYDRVEQDEMLSPFFPGGVAEEHATTSPAGGSRCSADGPDTPTVSAGTNA